MQQLPAVRIMISNSWSSCMCRKRKADE